MSYAHIQGRPQCKGVFFKHIFRLPTAIMGHKGLSNTTEYNTRAEKNEDQNIQQVRE